MPRARLAVLLLATLSLTTASALAAPPNEARIKSFFQSYCLKCHGLGVTKGDVALHTLEGNLADARDWGRWEAVLEVLRSAEMPPDDVLQPPADERQAVTKWIEAGLREQIEKARRDAPPPAARRLTNFEYQNTIRDLLGFELLLTKKLPQDPVQPYHFNNTAQMMLIGPEQMDRYLECARQAMASAIVDPGQPQVHRAAKTWASSGPRSDTKMQPDEIGVYGGAGRNAPDAGMSIKSWPKTGEYRIRVQAAAILPPGYDQVPLRLVLGSSLRSDAGTGEYEPVGTVQLRNREEALQDFEFRGRIENYPVEAGEVTPTGQQPAQRVLYAQNLFDNGELNDHRRSAFDTSWGFAVPRVVVRSIEFEAPVLDTWPPEHHTRILFESPLRQSDPEQYLRLVLKRFLSRAFRRPATTEEIDRYSKLYRLMKPEFDTFEGAMRETLAMVLISPKFLYHTVADGAVVDRSHALASKLSYFLWGSMPDAELLELAAQGKLDDPQVIETQVRRMLLDKRSGDFVDNFVTQWLSIAKMKAVNINQDLFPRFLYWVHVGERRGQEVLFRPTIRDYMHQETVGFVAELIRRNASVFQIIDSDFAYLNEPLAVHYGVEGVKGIELRPTPIQPQHHLGGLLTHGSVLVGNGTGSAPHPIYRAVWLREAILGDHVKAPPAEVPALADSAGASAETAVTIKDLLVLHRKQERCNDCHARLDPWGIPFERYNAAGRYQPLVPPNGVKVRGLKSGETYAEYQSYLTGINTVEVQADTRAPNGPRIDGMQELKDYLLRSRRRDIAENVIRRLLSYGLGRELTSQDRPEIDRLLESAKATDFKLRNIIVAICQSDAFRGAPRKD